jgi:hypothetical protein
MKRFRRSLFNATVGVSLCLLTLVIVFGVRSCLYLDSSLWRFSSPMANTSLDLVSGRGIFLVGLSHTELRPAAGAANGSIKWTLDSGGANRPFDSRPLGAWSYDDGHWKRLGFSCSIGRYERPYGSVGNTAGEIADDFGIHLIVPYWFLVCANALIFAILLRRLLKPHHRNGMYCARCGYDLRATPDRCPECGTIPPKKEAVSK